MQSQNECVESTERVFKVSSSCYGLNKLDTETYGNYGLKRPSGPGVVPVSVSNLYNSYTLCSTASP